MARSSPAFNLRWRADCSASPSHPGSGGVSRTVNEISLVHPSGSSTSDRWSSRPNTESSSTSAGGAPSPRSRIRTRNVRSGRSPAVSNTTCGSAPVERAEYAVVSLRVNPISSRRPAGQSGSCRSSQSHARAVPCASARGRVTSGAPSERPRVAAATSCRPCSPACSPADAPAPACSACRWVQLDSPLERRVSSSAKSSRSRRNTSSPAHLTGSHPRPAPRYRAHHGDGNESRERRRDTAPKRRRAGTDRRTALAKFHNFTIRPAEQRLPQPGSVSCYVFAPLLSRGRRNVHRRA